MALVTDRAWCERRIRVVVICYLSIRISHICPSQNWKMTRNRFGLKCSQIKADIRKQHDLYVNNLVGDVKANPRDFYHYINSQKKDTQGIPPLKKRQGGGLAQSDFKKASEFNSQFTDVFTKSEHSQVPLLDRSAPSMEDIVVTKEGVTKLLKGDSKV